MNGLAVWLERVETPVGFLRTNDSMAVAFRYSAEWLARRDGFPISLALPLTGAEFGDVQTRAYFENLLQENAQLSTLRQLHGLESNDLAGLLAIVGADLPGALSCLPPGAAPVKAPGIVAEDYDILDAEQLQALVNSLGESMPLPAGLRNPSPLAGYQQKIATVHLGDGRFAMPKAGLGVPTTHILKVPNNTIPREALYEAECARLATICGLRVARTVSAFMGQYEVVLSTRYDRRVEDGVVYRLHQEDFAQALGLGSRLKYERDGRGDRLFSAAQAAKVLRATGNPSRAIDQFLKATFFNLAIGNTDNHAKNHSLLYTAVGSPILAPLYDLVPIRISDQFTHQFAFNLGASTAAESLTQEDILAFIGQFGRTRAAAMRFLVGEIMPMLAVLETAISAITDEWLRTRGFVELVHGEIQRVRRLIV